MSSVVIIAQNLRARVEIEVSGSTLLIRPRGDVNEDLDFAKIFQDLSEVLSKTKRVTIDLGFIGKINSCGVREWLLFMEKLQARVPIQFSVVNEIAVNQAAVVPSILGKPGTVVGAFEVPYYCTSCRLREVKVCTPADVTTGSGQFLAPRQNCTHCRMAMEFDGLESEYQNFLKQSQPGA